MKKSLHYLFLLLALMVVFGGCSTSPQTSSQKTPVAESPQTSSQRMRVAPLHNLKEVFTSTNAALESLGAEIVSSELKQTTATVYAQRQIAEFFDYYVVLLTVFDTQGVKGVRIEIGITSDDPSRTIDQEDFNAFWVPLWEEDRIVTFAP